MASIQFTENLHRHITCPPTRVNAGSVGESLQKVFAENPRLEDYILDNQGQLRKHIAIFLDGAMLGRDLALTTAVNPQSDIFVMQALSGG